MGFDARVFVLIAGAALLGFLLYPRGGEPGAPDEYNWIDTARQLKDEPLHYPKAYKKQILFSYDLGFVYRIDKILLQLENPREQGPRQFDLLVSTRREGEYDRVYTYKSNSPEFPYAVLRFDPVEARWVQLVINDWFGGRRPKIKSLKIGAEYKRHGPIISVSSDYDLYDLPKLIDGLFEEGSKWKAARRKVETTEEGEKVSFEPPGSDVEVIFDLGVITRVYGTRITTDGPGDNLARYSILTSLDGRSYKLIYTSPQLPDETVQDIFKPVKPISARYVKLLIRKGDWHGDYAEVREFEVFTDDYKLPESKGKPMEGYNAVQAYYEDAGRQNRFAPHLVQGFPFDRGPEFNPKIRYFFKEGEEVEPGHTPNQLSFCYHYDEVIFKFGNLDPHALYWVQVTYLQERDGTRRQRMLADGFILHGEMLLPRGKAKSFTFQLPSESYLDGEVEIRIQRLAGPNAVVSELSLFQARPDWSKAPKITYIGRATKVDPRRPVEVDGDPSEWPKPYPLIPHGYRSPQTSPVKLYLQWDEENLYLLGIVDRSFLIDRNNAVINPRRVSRFRDLLDVFIDTTLNRSPGMYTASDHHFRFYGLSPKSKPNEVCVAQIHHHMDAIPHTIYDRKEIELAFRPGKTGYILEARIPKGEVLNGFDPRPGSSIGFNFILQNDYSQPVYWSADSADSPPERWGEIKLVGSVAGEVFAMDPTTLKPLSSFNAGQTLLIALRDPDRSVDPTAVETVEVTVKGERLGDEEKLTLRESAIRTDGSENPFGESNDSDLFVAPLKTAFGKSASPRNGTLTVYGGEIVRLIYLDPYYSEKERDVEVVSKLRVNTGHTGKVAFIDQNGKLISTFLLGDQLRVMIVDPDLKGDEIEAVLEVRETDEREIIKLKRERNGFIGSIPTLFSENPKPNNGKLEMAGLQRVVARYIDAIQDDGRTNAEVRAEARVGIGRSAAVKLESAKRGPGEKGFVAGETLRAIVVDPDENRDPKGIERVEARVVGGKLGDELKLSLRETEPDTGIFVADFKTQYALKANRSNDTLEVRGGEEVKLIFVDRLSSTGARDVEVAYSMTVNIGTDGTVAVVRSNFIRSIDRFNAGVTLYLRVQDGDEERNYVEVMLKGDKLGDEEKVTLPRSSPGSDLFLGSIGTEFAEEAKPGDHILQVRGGERVTVIYIDRLRSTGEPNVPVKVVVTVNTGNTGSLKVYRRKSPGVDTTRFRAGEVLVAEVTDYDLRVAEAAAITFPITVENEMNGDQVEIEMKEVPNKPGVFRGEVRTAYGVEPIDDELLQVQGGDVVKFTYLDVLQDDGRPNVPIQIRLQVETGVGGRVELLKPDGLKGIRSISAGSSLLVRVTDADLNLNPNVPETVSVTATGNLVGDEVLVTLFETGENTGVFEGVLRTAYSETPDFTDSILQVREKEIVTVSYIDPITETGETNVTVKGYFIISSSTIGELLIVDRDGKEIGGFNAGETLYFVLRDPLLTSLSPTEKVTITVSSSFTNDLAEVTLYLDPEEENVFRGSIPTRYGTTPIYDDTLEVQGGEEVVATYRPNIAGVSSEPITDTAYVNKGHRGKLLIVRSDGTKVRYFDPGTTLYFILQDPDLNCDPFTREETEIWVSGESQGESKVVLLRETAPDTGIFGGSIKTVYGRSSEPDVLGVIGGELVRAVYRDALLETGQTNVDITDSCKARMVGWAEFAEEPLAIDGVADGWPLENVMKTAQGEAMVWAQWDADNLYLFIQVYDEDVKVRDVSKWYVGSDAIEIHLDLNPSDEVKPYYLRGERNPSIYILWFCPKGGGFDGSHPYAGQAAPTLIYKYNPPIAIATRYRRGYYMMEIKIPFAKVLPKFDPMKTKRIRKIGFNFVVYRSDLPPVWWAKPPEGEEIPPSFLGRLYLKRKGE